MTFEQSGEGQAETKSYDEQMQDDVRSAMSEVEGRTAPETAVPDKPVDAPPADRSRDDQGRFAPKTDKPVDAKPVKEVMQDKYERTIPNAAVPSPDKTQPALTPEQLSAQAVKAHPPGDWDVKAKAQWDRLPQVVRDAIGKSTTVDPTYKELTPYLEMAKRNGQSLSGALQAYTGMEALIRRDPGSGMMHVAQNLGMTQHQAGLMFADLAQKLGALPQGGGQQMPAPGQVIEQEPDLNRALAPVLSPFQQRLDQLEGYIRQQSEGMQTQRMSTVLSAVEKFRQSPEARYYDNLEGTIANILNSGLVPRTGDNLADLKAAYDTACWQNPEIRSILIAEQAEKDRAATAAAATEAANKARQASRSVTGSPSPGASPGTPRKAASGMSYDEDLHNDVLDAIRSVGARA